MSRLVIATWSIPGRCDIRAMTYVINAHLRRHDTYRSWFDDTDREHIVHRTIAEASDINLVPTKHGEITPAELRSHLLATPSPLQWDCFRFAIIQRADHFTFCVCIDHLHTDAMFFSLAYTEIHVMYATVTRGGAPISLPEAGSYHDLLRPAAPAHVRADLRVRGGKGMDRILREQRRNPSRLAAATR